MTALASFADRLPTPEEEIWRYSRISELDLDAFTPAAATTRVTGATVESRAVATDEASPDIFYDINAALSEPIVVTVPPGAVWPEPVVVEHVVSDEGTAVFPRLVVDVGADAEVTVVERFTSPDVHGLVVPVTEIRAGPAARVRYVAVNQLGSRVWSIGHQIARGERDSDTLLASVALGGDYARIRTDARLVGRGATGRQLAAYFGEGTQMHDFRTLQDHAAPKTTSDLLFKGAVSGHSRSVYTGLIRVRKDAPGTNAFQTNRNIKLSEGAWAESVPNLEIENNDVRCSHASAVGPIDEEQRFYLESRGIRPATAERLIVLGFFDEVLAQLPVPVLRDELRVAVAAKLDRRERGRVSETTVCRLDDLAAGAARKVVVEGRPVALVRCGDDVYAIGDICSHANVSLSEGEVMCDEREIECWKHGSTFSLTTGEPQSLPATQPVPVYEVSVRDGDVVVKVA